MSLAGNRCTGCGVCEKICPKGCILLTRDEDGFLFPNINRKQCAECGLCEKRCPVQHELPGKKDVISAYAAYTKNGEIRRNSSSGGIFSELTKAVVEAGGVVFGTAFCEDFRSVRHTAACSNEELLAFRGSKYVQSEIGNSYQEAKKYLEQGRWVYFSGTPCQIGGLYSYLNREYDRLITQDFICHGVPSPKLWEKYLNHMERKLHSAVSDVSFRNKTRGWKAYSVKLHFSNGGVYEQAFFKNPYMKAFLRDLCLRPSCYQCAFKGMERQADITLADFWGIGKVAAEMDDDRGTSLVMIRSEKGEQLFEKIQSSLVFQSVDAADAIRGNTAALQSVQCPDNRDLFMQTARQREFSALAVFLKDPYRKRIRYFLGSAKKRLLKLIRKQ